MSARETVVMAGLVPAIHALARSKEDVDARDKREHDGVFLFFEAARRARSQ